MKLHVATFVLYLVFAVALVAQLGVPQPGLVRFGDGVMRAVHGLPANLIISPRSIASADFASFSDSGGLTARNGLIRLLRTDGTVVAEYQTAELQPLLNVDGPLTTAVAWLPSQHTVLAWNGVSFVSSSIDDSSFAGRVTSVRLASASYASFLIAHPDSSISIASVALANGNLVSLDIVPAARGRAFAQHNWILSEDPHGLVADSPSGFRERIHLSDSALPAGDLVLERMSADWLHLFSLSTGQHWAVYLSRTKLNVSLLPEVPAQPAAGAVK